MVVYVDDMYRYPMGRFRRMKMSHMISDSEEELHKMAAKIGVARKWYQGDHYDIAMSKRTLAIKFGAVPIRLRTLAAMSMNRRCGLPMGTPKTCHKIAEGRRGWMKDSKDGKRKRKRRISN